MKPQEKADQLFEQFLAFQTNDDITAMKLRAKYSAISAVIFIKEETNRMIYWEEVEKELQKMKFE
jgi:hypothetical protein